MSARHPAALGTASLGYFFVLLDVTIVNVALAQIGSGLGAGTAELQWVVDGYALALASLMLSAGDLGDLLGHRRVFAGGLALFLLASGACGLAPSAAVLIGARAVQGGRRGRHPPYLAGDHQPGLPRSPGGAPEPSGTGPRWVAWPSSQDP